MQVILSITGDIYPDRAAKQQTPVMQVIISITGDIYPDRAAKQQAPVTQVILSQFLKRPFRRLFTGPPVLSAGSAWQ